MDSTPPLRLPSIRSAQARRRPCTNRAEHSQATAAERNAHVGEEARIPRAAALGLTEGYGSVAAVSVRSADVAHGMDARRGGQLPMDVTRHVADHGMQTRLLEDRMSHQEAMLRRMLERAYSIHAELEAGYKDMRQGFEHGKRQRQLLSDHVHTTSEMMKSLMTQGSDFRQKLKSIEDHLRGHAESIRQLDGNVKVLTTEMRRRLTASETEAAHISHTQAATGEDLFHIKCSAKKDKEMVEAGLTYAQERIAAVQAEMKAVQVQLQDTTNVHQSDLQRAVKTMNERANAFSDKVQLALREAQSHCLTERDKMQTRVMEELCEYESRSQRWLKGTDDKIAETFEKLQAQLHTENKATRDFRASMEGQMENHRSWQESQMVEYERNCAATLKQAHHSIEAMRGMLDARESVLREELRREWDSIAKSLMVV